MKKKLKPIPKIKKELDGLWSVKVRERDGKCVMCGKTKSLQAHHYIRTKARSLKYRWDIRNGITLCYGCHMYGVHKTASFEAVSGLVEYAIKNEILTATEVAEIVHDKDKRDYGKDRGFLEASRINLEDREDRYKLSEQGLIEKMKVLNLYAGIGGNRKLWEGCEVTAVEKNGSVADIYRELYPQDKVVEGDAHEYLLEHYKEYDFIWTSPPCQTHSRMNLLGVLGENSKAKYIDLKLYQEIILLKHFYKGRFVVENVRPYYKALISPSFEIGRHYFWSDRFILTGEFEQNYKIRHGTLEEWKGRHGIDIEKYKVRGIDKRQIYRNCVSPEIGKYVFEKTAKE